MLLTAFFADDVVTGLDGYSRLISRTTGRRVRNQLLDVSAGFFYSFFATFAILLMSKLVLKPSRRVWMAVKKWIHNLLLRADKDYRRRNQLYVARNQEGHELAHIAVIANDQNQTNDAHKHDAADQINVASKQDDTDPINVAHSQNNHAHADPPQNQGGDDQTEATHGPYGQGRQRPEVVRDKLVALGQHSVYERRPAQFFREA
jgi:hypothetical protein